MESKEELKPVRCGCGGEARIVYIDGEDSEDTFVECTRCRISIPVCPTEAEAIEAWNRAMGITHERAVEYLQSTGWMQDHDREMTQEGYAEAKEDDEVSRRWEESYRASQMPWNHYTEMGG